MGRSYRIKPGAIIALTGVAAEGKLQERSERRAIVQFLVDQGGRSTIEAINERFGYDCRTRVGSLIETNWVTIVVPEEVI